MSVLGGVIGLVLSKGVVACEWVRGDGGAVEPRVAAEWQTYWRWAIAIGTGLVEQVTNGTEVRRLALEGGYNGLVELGGRETLEQLIEALGMAAGIAALGGHDF